MKSKAILTPLALAALTLTPARAADGTWLGASGNRSDPAIWAGGSVADGAGSTANFTGVNITANQTITVDIPRTIGNLIFTDATTSSHNLTLSGANALTLDAATGSPVIDVTQSGRNLTLSGELAGAAGLTKSGAGQLILSGNNPGLSGPVTVNAGILTLGNTGALGAVSGLTLADGARLIPSVDSVVVTAPITLGAAGTTATINAPTPGSSGGVVYTVTLNGAISGAGNLTLNGSNGSNTYGTIIFGTASDYAGSTLFTCSAAGANCFGKLGAANALPATTVLTLDGGLEMAQDALFSWI
jgi:autotransporter-associated beta strand protein